eukprot:jgi/Hompol1/2093/HPOL_003559-RA
MVTATTVPTASAQQQQQQQQQQQHKHKPALTRIRKQPQQTATVAEFVNAAIEASSVVLFSKSYCPFSRHAKSVLTSKGIGYTAYELDLLSDGGQIQAFLLSKTGQRTVPNIFIHQKHIGGADDLDALNTSGKLDMLIA